jgi:glycine C-acetyltransferase/8-amino-7-oxononanoate synthase
MDGDLAPLAELKTVARRYGALLMVDEAHATGVYGATGRGLTELAGLEGEVDVVMGTFSKAFGSSGGFVAGKKSLIDFLVNRARTFIYTTASSPAASAASLRALEICETDPGPRERLWRNVRSLRSALEAAGFDLAGSEGPIIPIQIGDTARALGFAAKLLEKGILAPAIRPPTVPKGTDRLRITVTAKHTEEHLDRLTAALNEARG